MQVLRGEQDGTEFGGRYTPEPWQSCVVVQRTMSLSCSWVDATATEANPTSAAAAESSHARILRAWRCRFGVGRGGPRRLLYGVDKHDCSLSMQRKKIWAGLPLLIQMLGDRPPARAAASGLFARGAASSCLEFISSCFLLSPNRQPAPIRIFVEQDCVRLLAYCTGKHSPCEPLRQRMSDSKDTQTGAASVRLHQPSPLAAEIAAGPSDEPSPLVSHLSSSAEGMAQSSQHSIQAERDYAAAQRNEAREDADELHQFRMLALERQKATGGFAGAGAQAGPSQATGGAFEPFVGSRVGSPIPDKNGLGWPGASLSV